MPTPPAPLSSGERAGFSLPLLAGLLLALAFPPSPFPLLAFAALAPLALALERVPSGTAGASGALKAGLLTGFLAWGLLLHWIPGALLPVAPLLALPAWGATVAALAGLTALVAWAALGLRRRGVPVALALPLAWTAGEWVRGNLGPLALPWLPLGGALAPLPAWVAPAELVGVHGLSLWVGVVGCGVVGLAGRGGAEPAGAAPRWTPLRVAGSLRGASALVALLLPPAWGAIRNARLDVRPMAEVAAVQLRVDSHPGIPAGAAPVTAALTPLLDTIQRGRVELILLPEALVDAVVAVAGPPGGAVDPAPLLHALAARTGAVVVAGAYTPAAPPAGRDEGRPWPGAGSPGGPAHNAALQFLPDGRVEVVHTKRRLVPGVERGLPPPFHRLPGGPGGGGGLVPGEVPGRLRLDGGEVGVLICYESAFPSSSRVPRGDGAGALLAMTHERWFGRGRVAPAQHVAHLQVRAVETRAGILRSALDGEALLIDPLGRVVARGGPAPAALVSGTLHTTPGVSFYVRVGDLAGSGAFLASLLVLASAWRRNPEVSTGRA